MTSESRGRLLQLAIAVNLTIVATGVALLFPSQPIVLLAVYVAAAGLAAWKGGWEGGVLATAISTVILLLMFNATFDESHVIGFIAAGVIVTAIMAAAVPHRRVKRAGSVEPPPEFGPLVAAEPPRDERGRSSAQRRELAKSRAAQDAKVTPLTPKNGKQNDRSTRG
jgi:hypothetical protein